MEALSALAIKEAAERIAPFVHRTSILTSHGLNLMTGAELYFKCENFQKVGAFKYRGATNALRQLTEEQLKNGVATHSSGNHAQALALAAQLKGVPAYIVMPENAPRSKKYAVLGYGAHVIDCEPGQIHRETALDKVISETGAWFIHPYNDRSIIAGQATCALELIRDAPHLDFILAPVGGGGLLSGTALAVGYFSPGSRTLGAEPSGADDAYRSLVAGKIVLSIDPKTIADGLLTSLGTETFPIIYRQVDRILTVGEFAIVEAMKLIWQRLKIVVEPSAAVPLAAVLGNEELFRNKKVGIILSGGNVDLDKLPFK
ncbi:MAG: pyridoxal-phosphate dependent enzyme [Cyclobacteriaceae bacterium]|nr:pyridoxal-phosphate dependent enzyme [Cyclobacteriaceae bacterium]